MSEDKTNEPSVTLEIALQSGYCDDYGENDIRNLFNGKDSLTVSEIATLPIPDKDKVWALTRFHFLNKKEKSVRFAVFCAEQCLPVFETTYPDDKRPRKAVEAAKNWLVNPSDAAYAAAAAAAADAAYAAADAAYAAAADAAAAAAADAAAADAAYAAAADAAAAAAADAAAASAAAASAASAAAAAAAASAAAAAAASAASADAAAASAAAAAAAAAKVQVKFLVNLLTESNK